MAAFALLFAVAFAYAGFWCLVQLCRTLARSLGQPRLSSAFRSCFLAASLLPPLALPIAFDLLLVEGLFPDLDDSFTASLAYILAGPFFLVQLVVCVWLLVLLVRLFNRLPAGLRAEAAE